MKFELLDDVVVVCKYKRGERGFIHTIKEGHDGCGCVYYVRFCSGKLVPYNASELKKWVEKEKVLFS